MIIDIFDYVLFPISSMIQSDVEDSCHGDVQLQPVHLQSYSKL